MVDTPVVGNLYNFSSNTESGKEVYEVQVVSVDLTDKTAMVVRSVRYKTDPFKVWWDSLSELF